MMDYKRRLREVRLALDEARLDALLISHLPNIRYLCGFTGSSGVLIIFNRQVILFTDGRYTEQAREEVKGARVKIASRSALTFAADWLAARMSFLGIGIEPGHLTVAERDVLAKILGRRVKLRNAPPIIDRLRMVKESDEVTKIRDACRLGVNLFDHLRQVIRPAVRESEVAGELEFAARKSGAEQMAFPTIIAGAKRSSLPHGRATQSLIPRRGFVVCDFGVILAGYCSDMTRTVHVGRLLDDERAGYVAVQEAQQAALAAVKPGVTVGEVDQAARKLLYNRSLGKFFTHSTGHGVGLEIHEAPRIAADQSEPLRSGMVVTIEPGIYLPGKWGVRIEDTVVVTDTGCEILTPCPKDLIVI
jgi:Xaa-Pro aminopeptidase